MKYLDYSGLSYFWSKVKSAINTVQSILTTHTGNTDIHITADERTAWSSKPSMNLAVVYVDTENWISTTDGVYKTVSVGGVTTATNLICTPAKDSRDVWSTANMCCGAQATGNLTFYAKKVPTTTVEVNVLMLFSDVTDNNVSMSTTTVSLTSSGWTSTTGGVYKAVTVSGVTSTSSVVCSPTKDSRTAWCEANLCAGTQGTNTLTFYADKAPTATVTVNVLILN